MAYRTILVHLDDAPLTGRRVAMAAQLAIAFNAHLMGAASTGVQLDAPAADRGAPSLQDYTVALEGQRQLLRRTLSGFEMAMRRHAVPSFEVRLLDGDPAAALSLLARHGDLAVLGQVTHDNDGVANKLHPAIVLDCGCPVLLVPWAEQLCAPCQRPLLAWDNSVAAAHALAAALPFLRRAGQVDIVTIHPDRHCALSESQSQADLALHLARHGIEVHATARRGHGQVGAALLDFAAEHASDMIVMGAYGRHRMRDRLLGNTTRFLLEATTIALLMAH
jgi:nucleotide-binding universal stress UspA family protein